jgi:hypothetical protein
MDLIAIAGPRMKQEIVLYTAVTLQRPKHLAMAPECAIARTSAAWTEIPPAAQTQIHSVAKILELQVAEAIAVLIPILTAANFPKTLPASQDLAPVQAPASAWALVQAVARAQVVVQVQAAAVVQDLVQVQAVVARVLQPAVVQEAVLLPALVPQQAQQRDQLWELAAAVLDLLRELLQVPGRALEQPPAQVREALLASAVRDQEQAVALTEQELQARAIFMRRHKILLSSSMRPWSCRVILKF